MYKRTTTASRRALAAEQGVRYRNVSVPLDFIPDREVVRDGVLLVIPAHYEASKVHTTFNVGASRAKGYKRALRVARRRIMRILKQQGRPFTGKVSLTSLMQAAV